MGHGSRVGEHLGCLGVNLQRLQGVPDTDA